MRNFLSYAPKIADTASMHKKGRILPPMHLYEALPQACLEYMKKEYAQIGASSLTCRSKLNSGSISYKRLAALMLH